MDTKYKRFLWIIIAVLAIACFFPFIFAEFDWVAFSLLAGTFLIFSGAIFWSHLSIRYTFKKEHLYIYGGIFRFKIPYEKITSVKRATDYLTGIRVMSATNGLSIFDSHTTFGEIKISPVDEETFLLTLQKHAPHVQIYLE